MLSEISCRFLQLNTSTAFLNNTSFLLWQFTSIYFCLSLLWSTKLNLLTLPLTRFHCNTNTKAHYYYNKELVKLNSNFSFVWNHKFSKWVLISSPLPFICFLLYCISPPLWKFLFPLFLASHCHFFMQPDSTSSPFII